MGARRGQAGSGKRKGIEGSGQGWTRAPEAAGPGSEAEGLLVPVPRGGVPGEHRHPGRRWRMGTRGKGATEGGDGDLHPVSGSWLLPC